MSQYKGPCRTTTFYNKPYKTIVLKEKVSILKKPSVAASDKQSSLKRSVLRHKRFINLKFIGKPSRLLEVNTPPVRSRFFIAAQALIIEIPD